MNNCTCKYCEERRAFLIVANTVPNENDRKWLLNLYDQIDDERFDANYNRAVLDGSWPSAVEQLEQALAKAKEIRERNDNSKR